ncbi:MAG: hypothetical protein WB495_09770 [Xanthobacteraceae bacterium]
MFKYPKTLERYRQILKLYVEPHIGSFRIQKLRAVHLNELYATLLRSGGKNERLLSACTVGHVHRVLHRALGHAATWGVVTQNVAALVGPPRVASTEIKILTEQQIGDLLRHLAGRTLRPIIALALATGARRRSCRPASPTCRVRSENELPQVEANSGGNPVAISNVVCKKPFNAGLAQR